MRSLLALWEISLVLCLIGVAALAVLVAARFLSIRTGTRRAAERRRLLPLLMADNSAPLEPQTGLALDVAAELAVELAELTRGAEREAMLARAAEAGVPALLQRRLGAKSAQTRLEAVEAIALFDQCGAEARRALDDGNPDVRLAAALALAQRADAPTPAELVAKLKIGTEEHSLLLVSLMGELVERNAGAVAALLFERDIPVEAKIAATDALAEGGGEYTPLLAYMATEAVGEPDLQPRIFRALGRNGHPAAAPAIRQGLESDQWPVRAAAAEAAGKSGVADAAGRLGELLSDENWWVRHRAGEALLRLGPRGIAVLRATSAADDETSRITAEAVLAEGKAA